MTYTAKDIPQHLIDLYYVETKIKTEKETAKTKDAYVLYDNDYTDIKEVIKKYLEAFQKDQYTLKEDTIGNIYVTPKNSINADTVLSAHMDKVHTNGAVTNLYLEGETGKIYAHNKHKKPTSLGADDKNGIFTILEMYKRLDSNLLPSVIFTVDEESGCCGSSAIDKTFFDDKRFCIVIDRRNKTDLIYKGSSQLYGVTLPQIFQTINPEYQFETGSISDANQFCDYVDCINISCGYYKPHSSEEYTQLDELLFTCDCVEKFLCRESDNISKEASRNFFEALDTPSISYYNNYPSFSTAYLSNDIKRCPYCTSRMHLDIDGNYICSVCGEIA